MIIFVIVAVFLLVIMIITIYNYKQSRLEKLENFCSSSVCDEDTLSNYSFNPDYEKNPIFSGYSGKPIYKYATSEYEDVTVLPEFSKMNYTSGALTEENKSSENKGVYGINDDYTINSDRKDICLIYQDSFNNAYDNIPNRVMDQFINWCHEYVNITDEFPIYRTAEKALHILLRKDNPEVVLRD